MYHTQFVQDALTLYFVIIELTINHELLLLQHF